jgi:outer membrane protein assembly factor BamB
MTLNKITDKQRTSYLHITQTEILTIDWSDGKNLVFYAFDKSENLRIVDKDYFGLTTVGNNYKKIEKQLFGSLEDYCSTKGENGDIYFCTHQEDKLYRFDKNGNKTLEWEVEIGVGHPIYDIKFESPDFMWFAFPTGQTVSQVSISEKKEVFKVGEYSWEDDSEFLSYPESIFITQSHLYIPNMGNNRLYKLDLKTKELTLIKTFEEKIWQYAQTEFGTFIVTDSGIYEMKE